MSEVLQNQQEEGSATAQRESPLHYVTRMNPGLIWQRNGCTAAVTFLLRFSSVQSFTDD